MFFLELLAFTDEEEIHTTQGLILSIDNYLSYEYLSSIVSNIFPNLHERSIGPRQESGYFRLKAFIAVTANLVDSSMRDFKSSVYVENKECIY